MAAEVKKVVVDADVIDFQDILPERGDGLFHLGSGRHDFIIQFGPAIFGARQCLAMARAIHFGASVLILDEPTAALGVRQSVNVLKLIHRARARGISVIFITHNVNHAYPVADSFTLLNRGRSMGTYAKADISKEAVLDMMAGGAEMKEMMADLEGVTI